MSGRGLSKPGTPFPSHVRHTDQGSDGQIQQNEATNEGINTIVLGLKAFRLTCINADPITSRTEITSSDIF